MIYFSNIGLKSILIEIDFLKEKAIYLDVKQSRLVTYWMTLVFQIVIHCQNLFNKYFGYQSTTVDTIDNSQDASRHHACLAFNITSSQLIPYQGWKYFAVWKDQDIICCHLAWNSDSQLFVDLYRGGVLLFPGTVTACKKITWATTRKWHNPYQNNVLKAHIMK